MPLRAAQTSEATRWAARSSAMLGRVGGLLPCSMLGSAGLQTLHTCSETQTKPHLCCQAVQEVEAGECLALCTACLIPVQQGWAISRRGLSCKLPAQQLTHETSAR